MMSTIERMKPKDRRMLAGTRASSHLLCSCHMRIQTSLKSQDPDPPSFLLVNIGKTALGTIVSIKVAGHEGTHAALRMKAIPSQPLDHSGIINLVELQINELDLIRFVPDPLGLGMGLLLALLGSFRYHGSP